MIPKISVIVPVYNVEKYISQCLDSLINQTLKEIEIICVDDASTDKSAEIVREYMVKDKRIILLHQKNSGPGVARNRAISLAKGKYITFVDSDDFLVLNALKRLYSVAEKNSAQVVHCNYQLYNEKTKQFNPSDFAKHIQHIYQVDLNKTGYYNKDTFTYGRLSSLGWIACAHLYLTSFLKENHIQFSENKLGEDHLFVNACNLLADKVFFISDYLYCYRKGILSSTSRVSDEVFSMFQNIQNMEDFLKKYNLCTDFSDDFEMYKYEALKSILHQVPRLKKKLFFKKCKSLLTEQNFHMLKKLNRYDNFFVRIKITKKNKLIIKVCKIPVFIKKLNNLEKKG